MLYNLKRKVIIKMNEKLDNLGNVTKDTFKILKTKDMLKIVFLSLIASIISTLIGMYQDKGSVLNLSLIISAINIFDIFLKNGAFNSFKTYLTEHRVVNIEEFFEITKQNIWNYVIITISASWAASFMVTILNLILLSFEIYDMMPISAFVLVIINQWLLFNGYIAMAGKDSIKIKNNNFNWMVFAIIKYLISILMPVYIIYSLESIIFMLFTLVYAYGEHRTINKAEKV